MDGIKSILKLNRPKLISWCLSAGLFLYLGASCNRDAVPRIDDDFNAGWLYYKCVDTLDVPDEHSVWDSVSLPHTANTEPLTVKEQWQGICYYKKDFWLSAAYKGQSVQLQFDAAMNVADVWINNVKMKRHMGGYLPFLIPLDSVLRFDTVNTLIVRLDNRDNPVTGPKPLAILDFNMYGGLYRNVHLLLKNKVHISHTLEADIVGGGGVFFATTNASAEVAAFEIKTHVVNQTQHEANVCVVQRLIEASGKVVLEMKSEKVSLPVQGGRTFLQKGSLATPLLWSPNTPHLYQLKTLVYSGNKLVDEQLQRVGLRSISITPDGLCLSGEKIFLRGVNRHQEYPYVGYALSDAAQYRDAWKIKQAGFDYVRSSHYPMSPAFLDACDELGIMVLDAILGWQYFGDTAFEKHALQCCRELIRRDRNHACVLAWELSINETAMPESFSSGAQKIAHEEYPYPSCYSAGWVRESYDIYIEARQHRHGLYKEKPLLVSEYGDWEYFAQNAGFNQQDWQDLLEEERNSRQPRFAGEKRMLQQALNIQEAHNDNLSTHAFADGYWVMYDYNRGMSSDQEYSGIMDIFRLPKLSYYFFQSQRSYEKGLPFAKPVLAIASYWQPGLSKGVRIFSNCDEVELFVDGQSVGKRKPDTEPFATHINHPPFSFPVSCTEPGKIIAYGYMKGKQVAVDSVLTPGTSDHIRLLIDTSGVAPGLNDLFFVYAQIEDVNNTVVVTDSSSVRFKVRGARVEGPSVVPAQAGTATLLVRTGLNPSEINILAETEGLKSDSLSIQIIIKQ